MQKITVNIDISLNANLFLKTVEGLSFVELLADFPNKYPICRKNSLVKRMIRCAVFKKN